MAVISFPMAKPKRLLVVDDDEELCSMLFDYFCSEGFDLDVAHDGLTGLHKIETATYDLVVLDRMLPGLNGLDALRKIRAMSTTPVIFLTARGDPADRILGLELGADDYVAKPFDPRELLARINAVLRRGRSHAEGTSLGLGPLKIDLGMRSVVFEGVAIALTSVEFDLLVALTKSARTVISREDLAQQIGRQLLPFDRTIDMHILNLRKKLAVTAGDRLQILTVRSVGYMLALEGSFS